MGTFTDLIGMRFGLLSVLSRAENRGVKTMWNVRCDCGTQKVVRAESLVKGHVKSCGCSSQRFKKARLEKRFGLVNQRFGRLLVLWRAGSLTYGKSGSNA